jgi:uncharacterized protein YjbI with pentapeptide repeats
VDLRGIPLAGSPAGFGDKDDPGSGVVWESLDLRRAHLDGMHFFGARIENCLLDSANAMDFRLWGSEVVDCSLRRTHFGTRATFGTDEWMGRRNVWRRVAFEGATLSEASFYGCTLEACSFENNGRRMVLEGCEVLDCSFRGEFEALLIEAGREGSPVDPRAFSADFSRATFHDSHIVGYVLDRTRLPEQDDLIVIKNFPPVVDRALDWLAQHAGSDADDMARQVLGVYARPRGVDQTDLCLDLRGIEPTIGDAVRRSLAHATLPSIDT